MKWEFAALVDEAFTVLPDGCQDLILVNRPGAEANVLKITDWDMSPRVVSLAAGSSVTGYRLKPGTKIETPISEIDTANIASIEQQIGSITSENGEIVEIINALHEASGNLMNVARQQGVSERTLQRQFESLSFPSPKFWRQLGRARKAAHALPHRVPLADIALEYGYSDQAHMTREFMRWFGFTPIQLRQDSKVLRGIFSPGLGNWSHGTV